MNKILYYSGAYLPAKKVGGPVTSAVNIVESLSNKYEFYIIASDKDYNDTQKMPNISTGWNKVGHAQVLYIDDKKYAYNYKRAKIIIQDVKPDLIFISGIIHPEIRWVLMHFAKKRKIPILISPRGELKKEVINKKKVLKKFILIVSKIINLYSDVYFHSTSIEESEQLDKLLSISQEKIFLIHNITQNNFVSKYYVKKSNNLKLVFISRIHEKKNLLFAIKTLSKVNFDVVFDIFGPIESKKYWMLCVKEIENLNSNIHINYLGVLDVKNVKEKFSNYDFFLFPTISENFGHVIIESLSAKCPVLLSEGTTPWDAVNDKCGFTFNLNNENELLLILEKAYRMDNKKYNQILKNIDYFLVNNTNRNKDINKHDEMFKQVIESRKINDK